MHGKFDQTSSLQRWIIFICGILCIAAVGISSRFIDLRRQERERRLAAENRLKNLTSQLQLLREKNRELAEQLREARRIAEDLAREREEAETVVSEGPTKAEWPIVEASPEGATPPEQETGARLVQAIKSFPLDGMSLALRTAGRTAVGGWRELRTALVDSIRLTKSEVGSVPERQPSPLLEAVKRFPIGRWVRTAGKASSSARDAFTKLADGLAASLRASKPVEPPEVPFASETPSESTRKLTATDEELRQELVEVRREKRELERQIAERTGKIPGSVNVGEVKITTGRRFSGRVLVVNRKHNFVVVDIGKTHGLEKGVVLIVHRGNKFVGKAQVIKVYEKMAAADLVMDWMQDGVQVSDGVKKF